MRVLIVASYNKTFFAPFIVEQVEALRKQDCEVDFFGLQGKGAKGYLKNLSGLKQKIKEWSPDIIHAHYGLSGLLANLQRRIPVVTTYHGSDINDNKAFRFSKLAMHLSAYNIFVSKANADKAHLRHKAIILPCGINLDDYPIVAKQEARREMQLDATKKYVLFAGAFDNYVKNAPLAQEAVKLLNGVELVELKGYNRRQVALLMQAVDAFLLTSFTEGSPQVIKEAMACGCPIVSVDVGDVKERIEGISGCYVASERTPDCIAEWLQIALQFEGPTTGREKIVLDKLDNDIIARKLVKIYEQTCNIKEMNHA